MSSEPFIIPADINEKTLAEAARFYIDHLGLPVFPLKSVMDTSAKKPGKEPMFRGYKKLVAADMTEEFLHRSFPPHGDRNMAIVIQHPFVWVDLDAKLDKGESATQWLAQHPELAQYPRVRTQHGYHLPIIVPDIPAGTKKIDHKVTEKFTIEVLTPGCSATVVPSRRLDGQKYRWEVTGQIPELSWSILLEILGIPEKKRGRPPKAATVANLFKGDLRTLDLRKILIDQKLLGECMDEATAKYPILCPWRGEHSDPQTEPDSGSVIWTPAGEPPSFKCLHAHCGARGIKELLQWLEDRDPGVIDKNCAKRRAYTLSEKSANQKRLITHPGEGLLLGQVAGELGRAVAGQSEWFTREGLLVELRRNERRTTVQFQVIQPVRACAAVEKFVLPVVERKGEKIPMSFELATTAKLMAAPQFLNELPEIDRILPLPLPVWTTDRGILTPEPGYNEALKIYVDPHAPRIEVVNLEDARKVFEEVLGEFCWEGEQDRVHAIARMITPYVRGIIGWTARTPFWIFIANRPRAGKDYLAGVVSIMYTGEVCEDSPLEKGAEETRKRITAALMSGRRSMHFANCQGHLDDAALIGAITARVIATRNLGSTQPEADLRLPNEIEFSISANAGLTYREDIEPRARRISLVYFDEDPNKRVFKNQDLHGWVGKNRGRVLGAVDAFVREWIRQGCPDGPTRFSSFPEWARVVGGIMQANGLGDPCLPHASELELGGDLKEKAMKEVYRIGYEKSPGKWLAKGDLFEELAKTDDEDAAWFGPWTGEEGRNTRKKVGMALKQYARRILSGIQLEINSSSKGAKQQIRFTRVEGDDDPESGNLGNLRNLVTPGTLEKLNTDGNKPLEYHLSKGGMPAEVSKVSQVSLSYTLVTDAADFPEIAKAVAQAGSVALDSETYGPGKGDALDPRRGHLRLLQLAVPDREPWVIDLLATGQNLGPLHAAIEGAEVIAHNARFDLGFLHEHLDLHPARVFCTLTGSQLLTMGGTGKNDLFSVLERHLDIPPYPDEARSDWGGELTDQQLAYAAADVAHLHRLKSVLDEELDANGLRRVADLEMELIPVVVMIEAAGLPLDQERLGELITELEKRALAAKTALRALVGDESFNPNSVQQVKKAFTAQGLNLPNTQAETLAGYGDHEFVAAQLEFRESNKQASMLRGLRDGVDPDGRLRASFNPLGTVTGRFSSKNPCLQNIPRGKARAIVKAPAGRRFVRADYSQIELRVAAALTGEEVMLRAFLNGEDLHRLTASRVTGKPLEEITEGERQEAKAVSFGFLYGQGAEGFRRKAKADYGLDLSEERARELRDSFFKAYPAFAEWHRLSWDQVRAGCLETRTGTGRRRLLPYDIGDWDRFTSIVNTPVQGVGADGMKMALVTFHHELPEGAKIILTVHDDVMVECAEGQAEAVAGLVERVMIEEMSKLLPEVPIVVETKIVERWG